MIVKKTTYKVNVIDVEGEELGKVSSEQNRISGEGYTVSHISISRKTGLEEGDVYSFNAEKWEEV